MTTVRTNRATNPRAVGSAGFATTGVVPGEVGTTTYLTGQSDGPADGPNSYGRRSVTTQGTGGSGGWTAIGGSHRSPLAGNAGDMVPVSVWVRYTGPGTLTITMRAAAYTSGGTFAGQNDTTAVSLASGVWVRLSSTVTATLGFATIGWWAYFQGASSPMPAGSTLDATGVLIGVSGPYFDGGSAAHDNVAYRWVGTANASTSEEYYALPTVLVEELEPSPAPSVGITVVALGATPTVFNVWRVAAGRRTLVRGGRNREAVDSDYLEDYEVPFNIPVTYEVEIISGPSVTLQTYSGTITVTSAVGWMQDPLVPSSAIPVDGYSSQDGRPVLLAPSLSELLYEADVSYMKVMGSADPVALIGQRASAAGVNFSMVTKAAEHSNDLRDLLMTAGVILVRPVAPWGGPLPPLCYIAAGAVKEGPRLSRTGDPNSGTDWDVTSPLVKAPSMDVLVPRWTWGDVEALYATWGQAETALAGMTWLDVTKNPTGA